MNGEYLRFDSLDVNGINEIIQRKWPAISFKYVDIEVRFFHSTHSTTGLSWIIFYNYNYDINFNAFSSSWEKCINRQIDKQTCNETTKWYDKGSVFPCETRIPKNTVIIKYQFK